VDGYYGPQTKAKAEEIIIKLRAPKPVQTEAPEGYLYRVQFGAYKYKENAFKMADEAAAKGFKAYVKLQKI
jgi:cell division septation protein DedD